MAKARNKLAAARKSPAGMWAALKPNAANFSALETKGGNYMAVGHAPKAGDGQLEIPVAVAP